MFFFFFQIFNYLINMLEKNISITIQICKLKFINRLEKLWIIINIKRWITHTLILYLLEKEGKSHSVKSSHRIISYHHPFVARKFHTSWNQKSLESNSPHIIKESSGHQREEGSKEEEIWIQTRFLYHFKWNGSCYIPV